MAKDYLIIDGHLDLAMNAMEWNRDLRQTTYEIRKSEKDMNDKPDRAKGTVSFPSMAEAKVFLCVATQIGRTMKPGSDLPGWQSQEQAWAQTQGQLAWYRTMEEAGEMVQIVNPGDLDDHLHLWQTFAGKKPIGYILSLEGADSIISLKHLEKAFEYGLRAIGPAHYGNGIYAQGTNATGGLGIKGKALIKEIEKSGLILDVTHLCDESFREALDLFHGPVWASHNNCRVFVPHNRQFSDPQIKELIDRDAVIGAALDAWMLVPDWITGESDPVTMGAALKHVINNIDHICQIAGNSLHAGIGSDLDGAFGKEQSPVDIDTITDLQKIPLMLGDIGYTDNDIKNIMHGNWLNFLRKNLPN
jgi:membrane dipeptidase